MKVWQLIEELKKHDPDLPVVLNMNLSGMANGLEVGEVEQVKARSSPWRDIAYCDPYFPDDPKQVDIVNLRADRRK